MTPGRVVFVGCGPGAADLLTLRAARAIAAADIVIWGRSLLVREAVDAHASPGAEVIAWPPATMEDVLRAYDRARAEGLVVARLKSGDPGTFGLMDEELAAARERGLAIDIVPGVSALGAAAAALGTELTRGGPLELSRPDGGAVTFALFMPGRDPERELRARGLGGDTPCAILHRLSWPGELVVRCRLDALTEQLADLGLDGKTLIVAGAALEP
jgi:precorrin-4/cobalt-precorrin-4 C11-methyltransferase